MDIIDVLVARALTPQGQIDTYAARAGKAVSDANAAVTAAEGAVANIQTITEQTTQNNTAASESAAAASQALTDANTALNTVNTAITNLNTGVNNTVNTQIKKLALSLTQTSASNTLAYNLVTTYPDNTTATIANLIRYYTNKGQNTNGTMTQKAITDELNSLGQRITTIENNGGGQGSGATIDFDINDAGKITIVGDDGSLTTSYITEQTLLNALEKLDISFADEAVGVIIDYENRTYERTYDAVNYTPGADFNKYPMYQRKRCNVNNNGQIIAWYGDNNYAEDGSNGDVMVYQPKFYYQRKIIKAEEGTVGRIIRKESIAITAREQYGFKIHPAFVDTSGNVLDYILIPAYESCYYSASRNAVSTDGSGEVNFNTDVLHSYANVKPFTGLSVQLNVVNAEKMAINHGTGWHITNAAFESMNQMLFLVEYGTMNGQTAIEAGICRITDVSTRNCASQTGSTSGLGNGSGAAASTINIINNNTNTYSEAGKRAISYRGMENPWGNTWRLVGGMNIYGTGSGTKGGVPYVCTDFNYDVTQVGNNYESVGFCLPINNNWISAMGYGSEEYDWVLMPAETSNANSALPVGDNYWGTTNLNGINIVTVGGPWQHEESDGLFYYSCDNNTSTYSRTLSARIMHIPTYNSTIYNNNIAAYAQQGGN